MWLASAVDGNYDNMNNWSAGVPDVSGAADTAVFGISNVTNIFASASHTVKEFIFNPSASNYKFGAFWCCIASAANREPYCGYLLPKAGGNKIGGSEEGGP
jgi:hypothetical protein